MRLINTIPREHPILHSPGLLGIQTQVNTTTVQQAGMY